MKVVVGVYDKNFPDLQEIESALNIDLEDVYERIKELYRLGKIKKDIPDYEEMLESLESRLRPKIELEKFVLGNVPLEFTQRDAFHLFEMAASQLVRTQKLDPEPEILFRHPMYGLFLNWEFYEGYISVKEWEELYGALDESKIKYPATDWKWVLENVLPGDFVHIKTYQSKISYVKVEDVSASGITGMEPTGKPISLCRTDVLQVQIAGLQDLHIRSA